MPDSLEGSLLEVSLDDAYLVARLPGAHRTLSWGIVGGGLSESETVVWREVRNRDLGPSVDPVALLSESLSQTGFPDAVGLLTSAPLADYGSATETMGGIVATCIATVGLANALTTGDPPDARPKKFGTINLLVWVSEGLSEAATIEALSIATEARTLAVLSARVPSRVSGNPATGTGTDCIVIASPLSASGATYAGKHTVIGSLIGQVCLRAMEQGIDNWRRRTDHG